MARPKKAISEKRNKRLTIYLTEDEEAQLNGISKQLDIEKAKFVVKAINNEINGLDNPPEILVKAKNKAILESQLEEVRGYICENGHIFWLDWTWPSPPNGCPCCNAKTNFTTWSGRVSKGFKPV